MPRRGRHYVAHMCRMCGSDDMIADVQIRGYVCKWCTKAQRLSDLLRHTAGNLAGGGALLPWQVLLISQWLRHEDKKERASGK